jgi:hypothetical protein
LHINNPGGWLQYFASTLIIMQQLCWCMSMTTTSLAFGGIGTLYIKDQQGSSPKLAVFDAPQWWSNNVFLQNYMVAS